MQTVNKVGFEEIKRIFAKIKLLINYRDQLIPIFHAIDYREIMMHKLK